MLESIIPEDTWCVTQAVGSLSNHLYLMMLMTQRQHCFGPKQSPAVPKHRKVTLVHGLANQ